MLCLSSFVVPGLLEVKLSETVDSRYMHSSDPINRSHKLLDKTPKDGSGGSPRGD